MGEGSIFSDADFADEAPALKTDDLKAMMSKVIQMCQKMGTMMEDMAKKKEYPYPPAPDAKKMSEDFEAAKKELEAMKSKASDFEKTKADLEASRKELDSYKQKELDAKVEKVVEKQFSKGIIKEEEKIEARKSLKDFSASQLEALEKQFDKVQAHAPAEGRKAEKGKEQDSKDAERESKIKELKQKISDFTDDGRSIGLDKTVASIEAELKTLEASA